MQFRHFFKGPRTLSFAQVLEISAEGRVTELGYEVHEGEQCISGAKLVSLAGAVTIIRHRDHALAELQAQSARDLATEEEREGPMVLTPEQHRVTRAPASGPDVRAEQIERDVPARPAPSRRRQ